MSDQLNEMEQYECPFFFADSTRNFFARLQRGDGPIKLYTIFENIQ